MQHAAKPIFLFAYANDKEQSLELSAEESAIRETLVPAHDQQRIEVIQLGHASLDEVYRSFNRFHNRIAVFHFGGHSNAHFLKLEDADARSAALSMLIGQQRNLQLVFLNGCANRAQVQELFDHRVKAVIATRAPIDDRRALEFSKQFYHALANGKTLGEAFETARSRVQNDAGTSPLGHYHHWDVPAEYLETDDFPWGLYTQDQAQLDWTLPPVRQEPENLDFFQEVPLHSNDNNKELVARAFAGMAQLSEHPTFQTLYQLYLNDQSGTFFNMLQNALLDAFPTMLSVQIRDLFTPEGKTKGRRRLREFDEAYDTLARLLCAIALANLWEAIAVTQRKEGKHAAFVIPDTCREAIDRYLSWTPNSGTPADHLWLVNEIGFVFQQNGAEPYVRELMDIARQLQEATEFLNAYNFFEYQLRPGRLANNIPTVAVPKLCREAEEHLGTLLQHCAFLCNYQLVTVKVVSVSMPRPSPAPSYLYQKAVLRGRDYATIDTEPLSLLDICSNNSVFITDLGDLKERGLKLNLSPFLIDQNAYKTKENYLPKIYFFDGQEDQKLYFRHADTTESDFTVASNGNDPMYRDIDSLFQVIESFQRDIGVPAH